MVQILGLPFLRWVWLRGSYRNPPHPQFHVRCFEEKCLLILGCLMFFLPLVTKKRRFPVLFCKFCVIPVVCNLYFLSASHVLLSTTHAPFLTRFSPQYVDLLPVTYGHLPDPVDVGYFSSFIWVSLNFC